VRLWLEGALSIFRVKHILFSLFLLAPLVVLLATRDQVIFVGLADLNFILGFHVFEDLLRALVEFGATRDFVEVTLAGETLLLALEALLENEVGPVCGQ